MYRCYIADMSSKKIKKKKIHPVFVQQFCLVTEAGSLFLWPKDVIIRLYLKSHDSI